MAAVIPPKHIDPLLAARNGVAALKPYIPGKPIVEVREELGLAEVVKLASNECPLPLPEAVIQALAAEAGNLTRYPDGHCRLLKRELAARLDVDPDCLVFSNGAEECIRLVAQTFLNHGDRAIVPSPIFDAYETASILCGAEVVPAPLREFRIDLNRILRRVDRRTKLVWLCSPANPTGPALKHDEFEAFLARLPDHVLVVLDEAYREFVTEEGCAHCERFLFRDDRVIGLRTFSKAFGLAGLRVGYAVAHPALIELIAKVKLPFNVNVLAQALALQLLKDDAFVKRHTRMIIRERAATTRSLKSLGLMVVPSQGNFLFVELPFESDQVFQHLLSRGFIIRPGSVFGLPRFMRLSLGTREQNRRLISLLERLLESGGNPPSRLPAGPK